MWDCVVIGCLNGKSRAQQQTEVRLSFHVFPHPVREKDRFRRWLALINNPRLLRMEPMAVFKSARVCRRHFASDCFNGVCRKLLPGAIPTLYLPETVRPVVLVQPMDAAGDEMERLLRDERRQQLKRHGDTPFPGEVDDLLGNAGSKRSRIEITLLSAEVNDPECNVIDGGLGETIMAFDKREEDFEDGSHASDSIISSVCGTDYSSLTNFSGLISHTRDTLDTLNQVEILNEPPENLLNDDTPPPEELALVPLEMGYELLVREISDEASNDEPQTEQLIQMKQPYVAPAAIQWQLTNFTPEVSPGIPTYSKGLRMASQM